METLIAPKDNKLVQHIRFQADWEGKGFTVFNCESLTSDDTADVLEKISLPDHIIVFNNADQLNEDLYNSIQRAFKTIPGSSKCFRILVSEELDD